MSEGHQYTDNLRKVEEGLEGLSERFGKFVDEQREHNAQIHNLLAGSEYGEDGLVKKLLRLESRVDVLESYKNKQLGIMMGSAGMVSGGVSTIVSLLI